MNQQACAQIPGWFAPPHGITEVRRIFGDISVSAGGVIIGPTHWESANMASVDFPDAPHALYCNTKVAPMIRELFRRWALVGTYELKRIGCFNPRAKRSSPDQLSLHSWGVAIDVNADENPPLRIRTQSDLSLRKKSIPDEYIEVAREIGWVWGGDFRSYWDPMHFQWASGF